MNANVVREFPKRQIQRHGGAEKVPPPYHCLLRRSPFALLMFHVEHFSRSGTMLVESVLLAKSNYATP
jgi:hypothetical protein